MECHIQTFLAQQWHDSAVITCPDVMQGGVKAQTFFEYELDYAFMAGAQAVSVNFAIDADHHSLPRWPADI